MQQTSLYNLDKLREIDDADDFILQVINIFLETVPANSKDLVQACAEEDWEQVYFLAHKMKANIKLLNIVSIIDEIVFVEQHAKSRMKLAEMGGRVSFIQEIIKQVENEMREGLG